jgi:hypothetical protein
MVEVTNKKIKLFREGIQDYEYFEILEKKIWEAKHLNINTNEAETALSRINEVVFTQTSWTKNPSLIKSVRQDIARQIESLQREINCGPGGCNSPQDPEEDNNNQDNEEENEQTNQSEDNSSLNQGDYLSDKQENQTNNETSPEGGGSGKRFNGIMYFIIGIITLAFCIALIILIIELKHKNKINQTN